MNCCAVSAPSSATSPENQHDALAARFEWRGFCAAGCRHVFIQATAEDLLDQLMREAAVFLAGSAKYLLAAPLPSRHRNWRGNFRSRCRIGCLLSPEGRDGLRLVNNA